jgi:peroxiredoxin
MLIRMKRSLRNEAILYLFAAVFLLSGLSNSCTIVQYSESVRQVLPATVRIIAGDSMGSGVVVGKSGLVLTSNHVIADNKIAEVFFIDGTRYQGRSILTDAGKDLALIQLEGSGVQFPCANLGSSVESDGLQIGDNLEIIGYPAFTGSDAPAVTSGLISGFPSIESVQFIQTCAVVYPGNSGGPVVNRFGEVIGIVNGKYSNVTGRCATFATAIDEASAGNAAGSPVVAPSTAQQMVPRTCPNVGCVAPAFTLNELDGKQVSLDSFKGRKVLLVFAGTSCAGCSQLMQCISQVYDAWPRDQLEVLVVVSGESDGGIREWASASGVKGRVLPDPAGQLAGLYKPSGLPATYFINRYGEIKIKREGTLDNCAAGIDALLKLY